MKILIQKNTDRDVIGILNALVVNHKVQIWDIDVDAILNPEDAELVIFTDTTKLGYEAFKNLNKQVKVLFLKCQKPDFYKYASITIGTLPYCADERRYPPNYYDNDYRCDVLYIQNYGEKREVWFNRVPKDLIFRIIGRPVNHTNYIGGCNDPAEVTKFCKSAGVCLDFDLEYALDLARIGCTVITDKENDLGFSVFNEDNIGQIIRDELAKTKPILNPYENKIISYSYFLKYMWEALGMAV